MLRLQSFDDELLSNLFMSNFPSRYSTLSRDIRFDLVERKDDFEARFELPGLKKENIMISLEENILSVEAKVDKEDDNEDDKVLWRSRRSEELKKEIRIPGDLDENKLKANYENGILTITLGKAPVVDKVKKIQIS